MTLRADREPAETPQKGIFRNGRHCSNSGTDTLYMLLTCSCLFVDQFPLLTTKKVFWKGILEELLWFIKVLQGSHASLLPKVFVLQLFQIWCVMFYLCVVIGIDKCQGALRKRSEDLGCQRVS